MTLDRQDRRIRAHADHADIVELHTASGFDVELMRTWYHAQTFPPHTHEYFTLGVMLSGVGTLGIRGTEHRMHPGDVVVIPPGEVHTGGMEQGADALSYLALHLPPAMLAICAATDDRGEEGVPEFASVVLRDVTIGAALRRLASLEVHAVDDALCTAIGVLVHRHADASHVPRVAPAMREPGLVRIVREIIDECYADTVRTSLHALAAQVNVTPFHLVRAFTQTLGLSPHRYVVQTRVRRASELLARGVPSSFVAAMTGFADQSHLTAQFKRYVGTTPASYQRCVAPNGRAGRCRATSAAATVDR